MPNESDTDKTINFLIYIVNKKVTINDELYTLTFMKDITFGVLNDQIKAQEDLRNIINNNIQTKIGVPLKAVVQSCQSLL